MLHFIINTLTAMAFLLQILITVCLLELYTCKMPGPVRFRQNRTYLFVVFYIEEVESWLEGGNGKDSIIVQQQLRNCAVSTLQYRHDIFKNYDPVPLW